MTDLSSLPPPHEGAPEGYYPDPLGGRFGRWWDGSRWHTRVGPEMEPAAPPPLARLESSDTAPTQAVEGPKRKSLDPGAPVGEGFKLYARYPVLFLVLAAGVILPYDLIALAIAGVGPNSRPAGDVASQVVLGVADWILITPIVSALHVHAVADIRNGIEPKLGAVARRSLIVLPAVVAATIMSTLGIAAGLIALIVPGVYLYFRWFVVAQAAAMDGEGWLPALQRSSVLTKDNFLALFLFILILGILIAIPNAIATVGFGDRDTGAAAVTVGILFHLFGASFGALTHGIMYFNLVERYDEVRGAA
jgi:hypothetical protein